jgi:hypothetical protein
MLVDPDHSRPLRIPDFSMVVNFNQPPKVRPSDPTYVKPRLPFWVEVKSLVCEAEWESDDARLIARVSFSKHLLQMHEQASFMFQNYPGNCHFGVLVIGLFFTVLRYSRPSSTSTTNPLSDPHTPPRTAKRKRANTNQETEQPIADSVEDWNPEPLYFCEPILLGGKKFNPAFMKALNDMTSPDPERFEVDIPFQPSFFDPSESQDRSTKSDEYLVHIILRI